MKSNSNLNFRFFVEEQVCVMKLLPQNFQKEFSNQRSLRRVHVADQTFGLGCLKFATRTGSLQEKKLSASWQLAWSKVGSLRGPLGRSLGGRTWAFWPYIHYFIYLKVFLQVLDFIQHSQTFTRSKDVHLFNFASFQTSWSFLGVFVLILLKQVIYTYLGLESSLFILWGSNLGLGLLEYFIIPLRNIHPRMTLKSFE